MKRRDILLIISVLLLAAVLWFLLFVIKKEPGAYLKISIDNELYGVFPLSQDQNILVGDTNRCQIQDGEVRMIYGDCPDQICVHSAAVSDNGQTIICMPNKVVLEIIAEYNMGQIDTIAE